MDFANLITTVGFPVACCMALAVYTDKKDKQNREDTNKTIESIREDAKQDKELLMKELQYNREVSSKLLSTNEILARDLTVKVDKILEKVGN